MAAPSTGIIPHPNSAEFAGAVTPSDTVNLPQLTRGLWIGGAGNVEVDMSNGDTVLFSGVSAGSLLPLRVRRVRAGATTATLIVAVY